jgi:signal transduction histidine kinase
MTSARDETLTAFSGLARRAADRGDDVNGFLQDAGDLAVAALGLDRAVVYRLLGGAAVVPVVTAGLEPPLESVGGNVSTLEERRLFRRALETREPVVARGSGEDRILAKDASRDGTVVICPLFGRDACLGFLAGQDGDLGPDQLAQIRTYADLAAAFLEQGLAQERLNRIGDLKSHFIALASHELRAPVGVIHGIGATLDERRDRLGDDDVVHLHEILHEQTSHLAQLVNQLLDLSRLEANEIKLMREEIPVRSRLEEIVRTVAPEHAPMIELAVEPELRTVADPLAFERIVSNLIVNAVRYGAPPVRVEAAQRDTHFRLSVEDRGSGVGKEFVPRLFERFAREEATHGVEGSGLGLAIAQSFANAHGGELLYSDAEPQGARFELVLPRPHTS